MYGWLRPWLFRLDPETAHNLALKTLEVIGDSPALSLLVDTAFFPFHEDPVEVFGLKFKNRIGLAAGFDKDGRAWKGLAALGFGHIEVGTVTPRPQEGNPRPRLFRLPEDGGLINRLGFPGEGAEKVLARLSNERPFEMVLGVNLGVNKDTPLDRAVDDYTQLVLKFADVADYLVVNVSSPNTKGLRSLQAKQRLSEVLRAVVNTRDSTEARPPLLVKLSPDLDDQGLDDALQVATNLGIDGVIATNTTVKHDGLRSPLAFEPGGLSGTPLRKRSTDMIRAIHQRTGGSLPIIGVGGVRSADDVRCKLDAGATLVQVYTGFVYEGPSIVRQLALPAGLEPA